VRNRNKKPLNKFKCFIQKYLDKNWSDINITKIDLILIYCERRKSKWHNTKL
jgi:hypothetical protein